jgi:NAD(P)-dependent dehydrogenase (short-subunit alcohol dehydrogenase family)
VSAVAGKVCVVTGAGSGIGRALAVELARRGARAVAISDVDEEGLEGTRAAVDGAEVHAARLDVADREAFAAYATEVAARFGVVHQLYGNAGIAEAGSVGELSYDAYRRVLDVNLWGIIHGTKELLPHLVASGDGHVVNVSSLNGVMAQAGLSAYCASKFAVRGFTESLALELRMSGAPVRATVVHPGGVRTRIATSAVERAARAGLPVTAADHERARHYTQRFLRMPAEQAARIIVDGVEADRPRVLVGNDARALDILVRAVPRRWPAAMAVGQRLAMRRRR